MPNSIRDLKRAVVLLAFLIAGTGCAQEAGDLPASVPEAKPTGESGTTVTMDNLSFTVIDAYFWRDWMPEVEEPGPDGGSPLNGTITVLLENRGDQSKRIDYAVHIVDDEGRSEPVTFQVQPDTTGEEWDGTVAPGERRTIELTTNTGPYIPAGSKVSAQITWTDESGNKVTITTPASEITQTF